MLFRLFIAAFQSCTAPVERVEAVSARSVPEKALDFCYNKVKELENEARPCQT